MANGDMLKEFNSYKRLSKANQEFYMFQRIAVIPHIQKDVKNLKAWKIKVVSFASGISAVTGLFIGKIIDYFK